MMQISQGTMGPPWHQSYHSSSSTSDLSNYDHAYLRRSPDRCSSQGSMESLEPSGGYPACHLLSPAKSTSSIDQLGHLHNKRDSAYSSFSTSSSILEYPPPGGSGQERSGSMDTISARGGLLEGMRQADIRYVKTVYDSRRGVSSEYEVSPSALLLQGRDAHASAGLQGCAKWHSVPRGKGAPCPSWSQQYSDTATDSLAQKVGAPMPPTRSDSYAAFRQRERPSSWSSLDQKRFCRPQTNSAGSVKTPLMEEQLHTVVERSPESSPPVKPKHSYTQKAQPGQPLLPTGIYPVPSPEPHFAQVPQPSVSSNGTVYPALVKESGYTAAQGACNKMATLDENGNQNEASRPGFAFCQPLEHDLVTPVERNPEPTAKHVSYKVHFSSVPENEDSSLKKQGTPLQDTSPSYPSERKNAPGSRPCSNHHGLSSPQALALHVGRPPQPWEGDLQEDHNANLRQKLEKEGQGQSQPGNFGKTKSAFSSLQNIPESLRRQSNVELGGEAQEGHSGGRPTCALTSNVEEPGRKAGPDSRSYQDRPVSYSRLEGKMNAADSFQSADPRYEEPPAPALQQTPGLSQRRLSSSSASALQYRKPHCSVLEKVSKIEEREQGRHRLPSVGSPTYGLNYRPHRAGPASSTSAGDFEDPKASIHFSEAAEPLGNGEPPLKNGESRFEEASWQPCGQPLRRAGDGRGPPALGGEPPRPDARLLRSQSTFQLLSDTEREAPWPEDRPGTPESPPLDAPFSRAYRNSIKDAQSRVLGATSFRRRDLEPGTPATSAAVTAANSRPWRPRPASAHVGMRSPEAAAPSSSPHTPRERHSVTPAVPQAAPRRGARRRLTPEQKKRSYSEPEKMNEVGVSEEAEPVACGPARPAPRFSESTVADRRRLFERDGKACSTLSLSGPELKQFQQSALADYVQRKTGKRPASAAACPQEPGLRERAQSAYFHAGPAGVPDGPGLASACSLSSLREPDVPLSRQEHPHLATDAPHAPRDRSSSFASGRLGGERRRWDPQPPRQPLSGANCGPRATQRPDRTPGGGPPSWSMVAANAGKSKSAEDLLERSDTLAVPVHVRSRSSPTSNKKGQDVLLREDSGFGFVKDPCCLAGPGSRSASCSDRGQKEPALPLHRPTPCWDDSGCKSTIGSSAPTECSGTPDHPKQLRTPCSRPLSAGMQGHFLDTRAASIAPPSTPLPSPVPSSYRSQLTIDQQTERSGQPGRQSLLPSAPAVTHRNDGRSLTQPPSPKCHELSSPEHGLEEGMWKRASLPQRPAPPWTKWAHAVREDSLSEDTSVPEFADLKHYKNHSLPSSCSTMDPDTPGRISLRISESALQASPPPRGDYEDEVFVKDLHPRAASSPTLEALPPPPPLPPPLSQETLVNSSDDFPPPPPQALCEAVLDSEAYKETGSSSSCQFPMVTVSRDKHEPGAVHSEGGHIMTPKPPQTPAAGSEAESSTLADAHAQPQLTGSLGEQASPSQTQSLIQEPVGRTQDIGKKIHAEPQKTSEDIRTEALAKEIVHQDKSLADILDPDSRMKTTMDLMEGLFPGDAGVLRESSTKRRALETAGRQTGCEAKRSDDRKAVGMLVSCPAYYSVSAAKAELLNKIKDMPEAEPEEEEQEDVNEKKAELIGSLTHKLEILQEAKGSLLMDIKLNNALGEEVEALISELCKPNEFDKYKMFIGDLDKVVNLLLSLSGRLARVENVLSGLGEDASKEERSSLNEKRKILAGQHEDARELKENLDRRERVVLAILANYLSAEQLQDYQHFVKMKSTLLIEQRKLDDKIKLGQEQVKCLLESLPSDFRPKAGAISLPPALSSHVTPVGGSVGSSVLSGGFPTLTSPL